MNRRIDTVGHGNDDGGRGGGQQRGYSGRVSGITCFTRTGLFISLQHMKQVFILFSLLHQEVTELKLIIENENTMN